MDDSGGNDYDLVPSRRVTRRARRRPPLIVDAEPAESQDALMKSLSASVTALGAEVRELRALVATLTRSVERLDQRIASGPATEKLRPPARRVKKTAEPAEPDRPAKPAKQTLPAKQTRSRARSAGPVQ